MWRGGIPLPTLLDGPPERSGGPFALLRPPVALATQKESERLAALLAVGGVALFVTAVGFALSFRIVKQYDDGGLSRLGRVVGVKRRS